MTRPPVTWQDLDRWATRNDVPGTAVLTSHRERVARDPDYGDYGAGACLYVRMVAAAPVPLTLGDLRRWAAGREVSAGAPLMLDYGLSDQRPVADLSCLELDPGQWHVQLLQQWNGR